MSWMYFFAGAGFVIDRLPGPFFEGLYRDTKYFALHLLGKNSNVLPAAGTSFLVSASSSIAEELFFRGFLFQYLDSMFHSPILSLLASSGLFGLAHFPVFGANAFVEAILGGAFGFSYMYSDYNLAVPIALHGLYDFGTLFFTWLTVSSDLRKRMLQAKETEMSESASRDPYQINTISRIVFGFLDVNNDGYINEDELTFGLRAFR